MKKILIFDLDGVLFDSVALMNGLTMGEYKNISLDDARSLHRMNIHEALEKIKWEKTDETPEEAAARKAVYTESKKLVPMYAGMGELVEELSKEYTLVINTSAILATCMPLLEREDIAKYFDLIASRELHSSKVEKFILISEKYAQPLADMVFITDTIGDLRESAEVALPTIAVTWGMHTKDEFAEESYGNLIAVVDTAVELKVAILNCMNN